MKRRGVTEYYKPAKLLTEPDRFELRIEDNEPSEDDSRDEMLYDDLDLEAHEKLDEFVANQKTIEKNYSRNMESIYSDDAMVRSSGVRNDPNRTNNGEDDENMFVSMQNKENSERMNIKKIEKTQKEIRWRMRAILIDWLTEVCSDYQLARETLYYAVKYIDFYLESGKSLIKSKFQLIGLTALFVASKMEEIEPPSVNELCYFSSGLFKRSEMITMEIEIVKVKIKK